MADISITAANVLKGANSSVMTATLSAGNTATQGMALHAISDGFIGLADAGAAAPANTFGGIALGAASPGQPVAYTYFDDDLTLGGTIASGAVVYVSNTAGGLTTALSDLTSASTVLAIGIGKGSNKIILDPYAGVSKA